MWWTGSEWGRLIDSSVIFVVLFRAFRSLCFKWNFLLRFHLWLKRIREEVINYPARLCPPKRSGWKRETKSEDVGLSVLDMAREVASKVDLISSKLSLLESIGTQRKIYIRLGGSNKSNGANRQSEFYFLKKDVRNGVEETNTLQTSEKFLNDEVEADKKKLRDDEEKS